MAKKLLTYKLSAYGKQWELAPFKTAYQADNTLAIILEDANTGEHFAVLTVHLSESCCLDENEAFVDTNNCSWAEDFITKNKLGEKVDWITGMSGWCMYPAYSFNLSKINVREDD